ncbi:WD repeat domain 36 [Cricetulus griseus]
MRHAEAPGELFPPGRELSRIPAEAEMESAVEGRTASVLFAGFRALGLFSNDVPHVVRYSALKRRFYVTTCVGKSFHTYDVQKLSLVAVSNSVPQDICCMAADGRLVFAAYGKVFSAFARSKEIVHTFKGHKAEIHLLQPFGDHVISVDTDSILIIWHVYSEEEYLQLTFDKSVFQISTILHPSTYLNKILLGSEQGSLQLWNVKSNLIDCFLLDSAPLNITMSPTGDFLATSHVDHLGIYLWSNISLYSVVSLRPLPPDYVPSVVMLPGTCQTQGTEVLEEQIEPSDEMIEYESPEQLSEQLVTLSLLPESRWKNLLNLDVIKKKNKPKEPPKVPQSAPFFIPTVPGLVPRFAVPEQNGDPQQSKVVNLGILAQKSNFYLKLEEGLLNNQYEAALNLLKELGPSGIETELRNLSPDDGGSVKVMQGFLKMIGMMLNRKRDFELAQAYLALFLKVSEV